MFQAAGDAQCNTLQAGPRCGYVDEDDAVDISRLQSRIQVNFLHETNRDRPRTAATSRHGAEKITLLHAPHVPSCYAREGSARGRITHTWHTLRDNKLHATQGKDTGHCFFMKLNDMQPGLS